MLYLATRRLSEASQLISQGQAMSQLVHAINSSNQMILSEERILRAADELFLHDGIEKSDDARLKRWLAFVMLNQWELFFLLHEKGHLGELSSGFWEANAEQVIDRILANDFVMELLESRGYHPDFVEFCRARRQRQATQAAAAAAAEKHA